MEDQVLTAIAKLEQKVDALSVQVAAHNAKLKWITSLALVVIGAVGGPNVVQLIATGGAS